MTVVIIKGRIVGERQNASKIIRDRACERDRMRERVINSGRQGKGLVSMRERGAKIECEKWD